MPETTGGWLGALSVSLRTLRDGPLCEALGGELAGSTNTGAWLRKRGQVLKHEPRSMVVLAEIGGQPCYLKLFLGNSRWQGLWVRFSVGRAVRGFDAARQLHDAGVPVPEPLGCLRVDEGALLATAAVAGTDLKTLWTGDPGHAMDWFSIMQRSAQSVAALHRAGYAHGDCKWANLVLEGDHCMLVDLDGVTRATPASKRQAADIARFTLNAEELSLPVEYFDAFIETYCLETGRSWSEVTAATIAPLVSLRKRHARKYGRRGHELLGR